MVGLLTTSESVKRVSFNSLSGIGVFLTDTASKLDASVNR